MMKMKSVESGQRIFQEYRLRSKQKRFGIIEYKTTSLLVIALKNLKHAIAKFSCLENVTIED